ncbi:MAG TPA: hypothetical protein VD997_15470 [Phycisphaerales bacterium]|nr:hypothetical protein [Phycisphaerales bacterium]
MLDARAHETDQYTLPLDKKFADMGDWLDAVHCRAVEAAVARLNADTEKALAEPDAKKREAALNYIRNPRRAANLVHDAFSDAFHEIQDIESALRSGPMMQSYPQQVTGFRTDDWIYRKTHYWIDPRNIVLMFKSSTMKAYGTYFGTDKLSHFHHMGWFYYDAYQHQIEKGATPEEASAYVVKNYADGNAIGENALLGFVATGVYSNADLAANFMGMKFSINVTQPVTIKGKTYEPMIVRKGEYFRVNKHVRPESGWFGAFVDDRWNEALNPSWYNWDIREDVRAALASRADIIAQFYTRVDGRPADPAYYVDLAHELSTYEGENYGHCQKWDRIMTVAQVCWPAWSVTPGMNRGTESAKPEGAPES